MEVAMQLLGIAKLRSHGSIAQLFCDEGKRRVTSGSARGTSGCERPTDSGHG
jgi:hypothetical protein